MANAAERVTDVLALLGQEPEGLTAVQVARSLSMSRAASSRMLNLMVDSSLIERDHGSSRYVLGLDLWVTSSGALQRLPVMDLSLLPMADSVRRSGQDQFLGVNRGTETIFLRHVERAHDYVITTSLAQKTPIRLSGIGRAILAFELPEVQAEFLAAESQDGTEAPVTAADLEEIREQGYSRTAGGVSVPVFASGMRVVAAVGTRLTDKGDEQAALTALFEVSYLVSRSLGYIRGEALRIP